MTPTNAELLDKYVLGTLSPDEREELKRRLYDRDQQAAIASLMQDDFISNRYEAEYNPVILSSIHAHLDHHIDESRAKVFRLHKVYRNAVAAAVVILISTAAWFYVNHNDKETALLNPTPGIDSLSNATAVTLSEEKGTWINLDSVKGEKIALYNRVKINKDGWLIYENTKAYSNTPPLHILRTPYGKQFHVMLADGTRVWLNATSSLRYPVSFSGSERTVELDGEGYFEVAKDPSKPFFVKSGSATVKVLGTHFNIKGYSGEPFVTTLLEGSVNINNAILVPGEQGEVFRLDSVKVSKADTAQVTAWKDGRFKFDDQPLEVIMREISRWYHLEVIYKTTILKRFTTTLPRTTPVTRVLEVLEMTGGVKFKKEGNKITVLSSF